MKEEVKNKLVEALRSGKYKQGNGKLRRDDKFCCLGVLCDLYDPKGWINSYKSFTEIINPHHKNYTCS